MQCTNRTKHQKVEDERGAVLIPHLKKSRPEWNRDCKESMTNDLFLILSLVDYKIKYYKELRTEHELNTKCIENMIYILAVDDAKYVHYALS